MLLCVVENIKVRDPQSSVFAMNHQKPGWGVPGQGAESPPQSGAWALSCGW